MTVLMALFGVWLTHWDGHYNSIKFKPFFIIIGTLLVLIAVF